MNQAMLCLGLGVGMEMLEGIAWAREQERPEEVEEGAV